FYVHNEIPSLPNEHEVILFRIIQECISNVIKHAKASEFFVSMKIEGSTLTIEAVDNGIGMPENQAHFGLGLKNILSRTKALGAKVSWEKPDTGGLKTKITYPVTY